MTVTALRVFFALETKIATFCPNSILTEGNKKEIQGIHFDLKRDDLECVFDRIKNEMKKVGNGEGKDFIKDLKFTAEGRTALHTAAINGYAAIAETIIKYTQQHNRSYLSNLINAATDSLSTALHLAANIDTVKCLLRHGAVFDAKNALGQTPLDLARDKNISILIKGICELFDRPLSLSLSPRHY
ncbi:ANK_REP_REGION domain-containing protein [Trichonephila clavipes]|nr:ANK_REP_REGION domain-containing protein [Trichonephila clavipes]